MLILVNVYFFLPHTDIGSELRIAPIPEAQVSISGQEKSHDSTRQNGSVQFGTTPDCERNARHGLVLLVPQVTRLALLHQPTNHSL